MILCLPHHFTLHTCWRRRNTIGTMCRWAAKYFNDTASLEAIDPSRLWQFAGEPLRWTRLSQNPGYIKKNPIPLVLSVIYHGLSWTRLSWTPHYLKLFFTPSPQIDPTYLELYYVPKKHWSTSSGSVKALPARCIWNHSNKLTMCGLHWPLQITEWWDKMAMN